MEIDRQRENGQSIDAKERFELNLHDAIYKARFKDAIPLDVEYEDHHHYLGSCEPIIYEEFERLVSNRKHPQLDPFKDDLIELFGG